MKKNIAQKMIAVLVVCMMLVCGINMIPVTAATAEENEPVVLVSAPAAEEPATEEPAAEEPAEEEPADEEPADEEPADEEPADEEPADEEPADEEPAEEEPADEKPADEKPADEKPADEEPAADAPAADTPVTGAPAADTPAADTPAAETPAAAAPAAAAEEDEDEFNPMYADGETVIWEAMDCSEENGKELRTVEDGTFLMVKAVDQTWDEVQTGGYVLAVSLRLTQDVEEPEAEEPAAEEPAAEAPAAEEPAAETPAAEAPAAEEPAAEEPAAEEPAAEEPAAEEPAAEEPAAEEPAAEEPAAEEPVAEIPAAEEPAAEDVLYFDDYQTAMGIPGQAEAAEPVVYTFERDENGELILDEKGNPIAIVPEGAEIPVTYLRDENGELILDENGDPIVTQTVPADAVIVNTLEDALNPDRTIDIYYSWNNEKPELGGTVTFIAVLYGYDNLEYTIQWQESADNENWYNIADANDIRYEETITRENYRDFWRVQVTITGTIAED